jgi:glycosyltransferase involved in cell wall biosynthesis
MPSDMNLQKKILIITTLAPPAFGGTPTMTGKYLRYFPKGEYFFLADEKSIYTPRVSDFLPCKYYFFDGTCFDCCSRDKLKLRATQGIGLGYKKIKTSFDRALYIIKYIAYAPFDFFYFARSLYRGYRAGVGAIKKEKPTHILAVSDKGPAFLLSFLLAKRFNLPFSVFLFDLYKGYFLPAPQLLLSFFTEGVIMRRAANIISAGEGISEVYDNRYGRKCVLVPNSCEIFENKTTTRTLHAPLRVVYTGMYYWAQQDAIERFRNTIKGRKDIIFESYSFDAQGRGNKGLSLEESRKVQSEADVVLLPLSFYPRRWFFREIIRTAPTGKLAEYLASGTPILVYAPKYAWVSSYIRKHNAGVVVDDESEKALLSGLQKIKDDNTRIECVKNALDLARRNHDIEKNSKILYNSL